MPFTAHSRTTPRDAGGVREAAAVTALGALLAIVLTFPLAFKLGEMGRIDNGDGQYAIWNIAWVARTLVLDPAGVFDANIFHPHRRALAYSESNLATGALAIPAYWATRNPVAAYNSVLLLSFVLSFIATYYLVRYICGSRPAAIVAAAAFAFCPYVFARTAHIQLMMTAGLPASLLAFHRFVDRPTGGRGIVVAIALVVQALLCGYFGIFASLAVGLGFVFFGVTRGTWRQPRYWAGAAFVVIVTGLLMLPFYLPYAEVRQATGFGRTLDDARMWSADWRAWFASSAWAHRWMLPLLGRWRDVLFPGFILTLLGAAGAWAVWRARRQERRLAEYAAFYALAGGLALWTTFGPKAGLYTVLFHAVPGFGFLRAPGRAGILVPLALAVIGAVGLHLILRTRPAAAARLAVTALVAGLVAELAVIPIRWRQVLPPAASHRVLGQLPRGAVVELPFFAEHLFRHSLYMYLSTAHWQPLVNGYSDMTPEGFVEDARIIQHFPTAESFQVLRKKGARYVVVHLAMYGAGRHEMLARLKDYGLYLRPVFQGGEVLLYEIVEWPDGDTMPAHTLGRTQPAR